MCGLVVVGANRNGHTGQKVYNLYKKQEKRGKQGFGFLSITNGKLTHIHRSKTEEGIKKFLMKDRSDLILFHHRKPTSTANTLGTTHPMRIEHDELKYDYIFAHNGVISNASFLKTKHNGIGYEYKTEMNEITSAHYVNSGMDDELINESTVTKFNDSEALAIELVRYIEGITNRVNTYGGVAFWGISLIKGTNKVHKIYYGKNMGRELKSSNNKKWFVVASESGEDLDDMVMTTIDYKTGENTNEVLPIDPAKPYTVGYKPNSSVYVDRRAYSLVDKSESYVQSQLKNSYYTRLQAIDTGVPLIDFEMVTYKNSKMYIPKKYMGIGAMKRQPLTEPKAMVVDDELPTIYSEKVVERIQDLAKKYVKIEKAFEDFDEEVSYGLYDSEYYKKDEQKLLIELEKVEDEISSMNIDEETQEFFIEKERELITK